MWIFTVNGFFTVIQDRKDPAFVWLRARMREDIERNFPGVEVQEHPGADYLFRAKLPREQVAQRLFELAMENNVTSHFKDVMIAKAAKPEFGSRSSMLYGVWNAGAAMQPIPPYSKTPRSKFSAPKSTGGSRQPGYGQQSLPMSSSPVTSARGSYRGSEFDWDRQAWGNDGGDAQRDPDQPPVVATDAEFDAWWAALSPEQQQAELDEAELTQRTREELDEDFGAAARTAEFLPAPQMTDVFPAPRNRPGSRKQRRKAKRANRHNQTPEDFQRYAQERRDGKHGSQQRDRQTFLDNQEKRRNGKA